MNTTLYLVIIFQIPLLVNSNSITEGSNSTSRKNGNLEKHSEAMSKTDELSKRDLMEVYYELISRPKQDKCRILKKFAGQWLKNCGFLDGEKLICMDHLYESIQNKTCLVYSFGLADDWDFEIAMANLGKFLMRFHTKYRIFCK